ncbi:unnamed protein product [Peronospora destructor]|uniref:FHA domain-containing protein n=1 Tax=Peronospora destructor TaxID=86335 RepID=A0AAV0UJL4_9STRA|nr:unnamed protein product [Peronospora destructor]
MSSPPLLLPWGRLMLACQQKNKSMSDCYELSRSMHCIGRIASRCDIHIQEHFISGLHCIIRLMGKENDGTPLVEIEDQSSYGTWVNTNKVGHRRKAMLKHNDRIHFTPPDSKHENELVYKLKILPSGLTKVNEDLHARLSADLMPVANRTRKRTHEKAQCTRKSTKGAAGKNSCVPVALVALKKAHAEELAEVKAELAKANEQAAAELRATQEEMGKLRKERDALKRRVDQILQDPNVAHREWSVTELEAKISVQERAIRQDDLASQTHDERVQTTPASRRQRVEIERKVCEMKLKCYKTILTEMKKQCIEIQRKYDEVAKKKESTVVLSSGSSQSQDSIDNGRLHNDRLQLSVISNEHSEPSPDDAPQTFDAVAKEAKSGDASQNRRVMFTIYGVGAGIPDKRTIPHSHSQLYRTSIKSNGLSSSESPGQENDDGEEETKGCK